MVCSNACALLEIHMACITSLLLHAQHLAQILASCLQTRNVLKKEPMGKDISETDVFSFNEEFHNKLYKIKIATVSAQKESEPEKQETRHKVSQLA